MTLVVKATSGLALIGPPGVGKGTQAARPRQDFQLAHIATGDLLREHQVRDTELGRQASAYMTSGRLVADALILPCADRDLTAAIFIDAPDETVVERIAVPTTTWTPSADA